MTGSGSVIYGVFISWFFILIEINCNYFKKKSIQNW
jgi:hypothetical protein